MNHHAAIHYGLIVFYYAILWHLLFPRRNQNTQKQQKKETRFDRRPTSTLFVSGWKFKWMFAKRHFEFFVPWEWIGRRFNEFSFQATSEQENLCDSAIIPSGSSSRRPISDRKSFLRVCSSAVRTIWLQEEKKEIRRQSTVCVFNEDFIVVDLIKFFFFFFIKREADLVTPFC